MTRIGIMWCENRSMLCAGINCFRAISSGSGHFARYAGAIEIAGHTTCGGCPGTKAKRKAESMIRYGGAEVIHLSGCLVRGHANKPLPDPNMSLEDIAAALKFPTEVFNQKEYELEVAKALKSGELPRACPFLGKIVKDLETLSVEIVKGTH